MSRQIRMKGQTDTSTKACKHIHQSAIVATMFRKPAQQKLLNNKWWPLTLVAHGSSYRTEYALSQTFSLLVID